MADEVDIANEYLEREMSNALDGIRGSLSSMSNGEGLLPAGQRRCKECDELISEARIRAVPGATLCVDCMNEREMDLRRK